MPRYGLLVPAGLGFILAEENGEWVMRSDNGESRPAALSEVVLWQRLLAEREEVHASRMRVQRLTEAMTDVLATVTSLQDEVATLRKVIGPEPTGSR
jgi:GAF domain-containing protein